MKTKKSFILLVVLMLFSVPVLTACGPQKVNVDLQNYKVVLSANSVSAGDITFHIANTAADEKHEFLIIKTDLAPDQLPLSSTEAGRIDEESTAMELLLDSGELDPGASVDKSLKLEAGNYVVICNIKHNDVAHYQAGMREAFTVK